MTPEEELKRRLPRPKELRQQDKDLAMKYAEMVRFKRKVCAACGYSDKETHADGTWVCHRCGEGGEP